MGQPVVQTTLLKCSSTVVTVRSPDESWNCWDGFAAMLYVNDQGLVEAVDFVLASRP